MSMQVLRGMRDAYAGALVHAHTMNPRLREEPRHLVTIAVGVALGTMLVGAVVVHKAFPRLWKPKSR